MYFVTGTDTDCGKTLVSCALLHRAGVVTASGHQARTLGLKPVASGCEMTPDGLRNSDACALLSASTLKPAYWMVNPFAFEPAIAPHIAAQEQGVDISPESLMSSLDLTQMAIADFCLIEGAGGWRLPLGQGRYMSELVQYLSVPVILVVGMKLGCLNHAVLTLEAIKADGLEVAGWVANCVDPEMSRYQENLDSLKTLLDVPLLGEIPFLPEVSPQLAANFIRLPRPESKRRR
ncbi:dethiobiotin synthase [Shewanella sp. GXUN23E]|uniref:dethiobiotin synthase n=1 Tax=Shewanella sp. GXUN23E TaxID=3422498 RepID=UPI003D7D8BB2